MMKRITTMAAAAMMLSLGTNLMAQESAATQLSISAGRPGQATGTTTCHAGKWQWETGVGVERNKRDDADQTKWTLTTNTLRYGLSSTAELRLTAKAVSTDADDSKTKGLAPISIGTKIKMMDGEGWRPTMSFLGTLTLPTGKSELRPRNASPSLYLLMRNSLPANLTLTYNVGAECNGNNGKVTTFAAAYLDIPISQRWGAFVESFNYMARHTKADCYVDLGLYVAPCRTVQLDASLTMNMNDTGNYMSAGLGLCWLID